MNLTLLQAVKYFVVLAELTFNPPISKLLFVAGLDCSGAGRNAG